MAKEYVKLWLSYDAYFEPLSTDEVGRLALAMLAYKARGTQPSFSGNERFIWPAIQRDIDLQTEAQEHTSSERSAAGRLGGRPRKAAQEKLLLLDESKKSHGQGQGQSQGQGQGQSQGQGQGQSQGQSQGKKVSDEISQKSARQDGAFIPPTAEQAAAYCRERENGIDAAYFVDYYTANGWTQGKGRPLKDWKAAVRAWERNGVRRPPQRQEEVKEDYSFDLEAFERAHKWRVPELPEE